MVTSTVEVGSSPVTVIGIEMVTVSGSKSEPLLSLEVDAELGSGDTKLLMSSVHALDGEPVGRVDCDMMETTAFGTVAVVERREEVMIGMVGEDIADEVLWT